MGKGSASLENFFSEHKLEKKLLEETIQKILVRRDYQSSLVLTS